MCAMIRLLLASVLLLLISSAKAADIKKFEQEISDSMITAKITVKFTENKNLNPFKIGVSTDHGKVTLKGHVNTKEDFLRALRITKNTKGVTNIDCDKLFIHQVNTVFTDAYITGKVEAAVLKAKVLDDESIPLAGINAQTINGVVTLSGNVKKSESVSAIIKRVSVVRGVKKVISHLRIVKDLS